MHQYLSIALLILILFSQFVFTNCSFSKFELKDKKRDTEVVLSLGQAGSQTIPTGNDVRYIAPDGGKANDCTGKSLSALNADQNCAWSDLDEAMIQNEVINQTVKVIYIKSGNYDLNQDIVGGLKLVGDCQNQPIIKIYKSIGAFNIEMHQAQVQIDCITVTDF